MALGSIPCIIWILYSPKMVESPRYTLIEKNNTEQAQEDLRKLRGVEDVSAELAELEEEAAKLKAEQSEDDDAMTHYQSIITHTSSKYTNNIYSIYG